MVSVLVCGNAVASSETQTDIVTASAPNANSEKTNVDQIATVSNFQLALKKLVENIQNDLFQAQIAFEFIELFLFANRTNSQS